MPESTPSRKGHLLHPLEGHFKAFSSWRHFGGLSSALDYAIARGDRCPEEIRRFLEQRCCMLNEIDALELSLWT